MRFSLKKKIALYIAVSTVLMSFVALALFSIALQRVEEDEYTRQSLDLARTVATVVDADRVSRVRDSVSSVFDNLDAKVSSEDWGSPEFEAYLANYAAIEESEDFLFLRTQLRQVLDVNHVESLYLMYVDEAEGAAVYLVDAAVEDVCRPGTFDELEGADLQILEYPADGFEPNITNTDEYGWTIATAKPIYDAAGNIVGYACVDISMNDVVAQRDRILGSIALSLVAAALLVMAGGILFADRVLVRPINALSDASVRYYAEDRVGANGVFDGLDIHTGDEIEILFNSMAKMEKDIQGYAQKLEHMAVSDSLTRVRNKRAYDMEAEKANAQIREGDTAIGIAMIDLNDLKSLNDTYGHDKGDIALKTLCSLVCRVFKHSPVFRIGGDEFVVVLRNHDLEHVDELMAQVDEGMQKARADSSLEPWERVSAAVGYAVFDPATDEDLSTVFARADEAMYERKKTMKHREDQ